jgi:hypothetical protein
LVRFCSPEKEGFWVFAAKNPRSHTHCELYNPGEIERIPLDLCLGTIFYGAQRSVPVEQICSSERPKDHEKGSRSSLNMASDTFLLHFPINDARDGDYVPESTDAGSSEEWEDEENDQDDNDFLDGTQFEGGGYENDREDDSDDEDDEDHED